MSTENKTKTVVYSDGSIMQIPVVRDALFDYWRMSVAEKRAFKRMMEKYPEVPEQWKKEFEALPPNLNLPQ